MADRRGISDERFLWSLSVVGGSYVLLIVALLAADVFWLTERTLRAPAELPPILFNEKIRFALWFSVVTCTASALLSVLVAVPLGYLLSRHDFRGKWLVDALLDIPIVLPPLVIGLSLLLLFQTWPGRQIQKIYPITYEWPSVIIAQFSVACAFAVRTMRVTFDEMTPRREQVALTLGCGRAGAFFRVALPQARRGMLTAATLAWARSLGEFGPILVFSGTTRMKTEVLSTTVFLELSVGDLRAAVAVSLLMVIVALAVLLVVRVYGMGRTT
jgi:molybdate transport system permease protein